MWRLSWKADPAARGLADRHYNRHHPGAPQFVPPGRAVVLLSDSPALWISSWPFAEYVRHDWAGAWVCSCFRNEGSELSSVLVREAVAVTRWRWPEVPALGMVTFIDPTKVRPKPHMGYCFRLAGFQPAGETKGGLVALRLAPADMPAPAAPAPRDGALF
jgi:hypothetical protein